MPRIWTVLLLAAWVISPGRALAKPHGPGHCDPSHIQAEIKSTHQVPDLTGCRPEVVGPALSSEDYRLNVENRVASANIPEGRIVRQRVEGNSSKVYVDVSAGSPYKPQQPAGGHEPGHHSPNVGDVLGGIVGTILTNLPPPNHEPQVPPTNTGMPPPPPPQEPGPNPFTGVTAPPPPHRSLRLRPRRLRQMLLQWPRRQRRPRRRRPPRPKRHSSPKTQRSLRPRGPQRRRQHPRTISPRLSRSPCRRRPRRSSLSLRQSASLRLRLRLLRRRPPDFRSPRLRASRKAMSSSS